MNNRQLYIDFCRNEPDMPVFLKSWWLDSVCEESNWDVVLVERGGQIVGALPYSYFNKKGFLYIDLPKLTPFMGPWIKYPAKQKYVRKLSYEKEIISELIDGLPGFSFFRQNLYYNLSNWLPFYWKGFNQTTCYSYILDNLNEPEELYREVEGSIRTSINKAVKHINVIEDGTTEQLYSVIAKTFTRKGKKVPYSQDFVTCLVTACKGSNCAKIFLAIDKKDRIHAGVLLVWDDNSAYYLLGGSDPVLRNSGASTLVLWSAIRFASTVTKMFDFEGSMIEDVERFFRAFGAVQRPYSKITKYNSFIIKCVDSGKECLKLLFK